MELITAERLPGFGCSFPSAIVWVGLVVASMKCDTRQIPLGLGKTRNKRNGAFPPHPGARPQLQDALTPGGTNEWLPVWVSLPCGDMN